MESKVISQKRNPFLEREDIVIQISEKITPSKEEVVEFVGKGKEVTVVRKISSGFGKNSFTAEVFVYDSKEAKDRIEVVPKKIKKKIEEERKAREMEEAKKKAEEEAKLAETAKAQENK